MSPALESNAGDRYHFVLAARRVLDLLHPTKRLQRVVLEGVAPEDTGSDEDAYLGVDLASYFGGSTLETADELTITQIKYSPTHPNKPWTLAQLAALRHSTKPASSILGKLGVAFAELHARAPNVRYRIEVLTNRPLDASDTESFIRVRDAIAAGEEGGLTAVDLEWLATFKRAVQVDGPTFARFVLSFDITGFGSPLLSRAEGQLAEEVATFVSDGLHVGDLLSFIQEHAIPDRRTDVTREDVLRQLRLFEEDFQPAPASLEPSSTLFGTRDSAAIAEAVRALPLGILLAHGLAGRGKTSAVQILARDYAEEFGVIVYDCFGGGSGVQAGHERFPFASFFTQVINDLDAAVSTNVIATTRIEYGQLARRFELALERAAIALSPRKLVIAIDAVDNAAIAAVDSVLHGEKSFIPLLSKIRLPHATVFLLTARSENVDQIPVVPAASVELRGFTKEETLRHSRGRVPTLSEEHVDLLHEFTNGTARVQTRILEALAEDPSMDAAAYIRERAKASAFEFYEHEAPNRLRDKEDRAALAILAEATQPIQLDLWAKLAKIEKRRVEHLRGSLAFGLRQVEAGIEWRDQEFWDFIREFLADEQAGARAQLADYCIGNVATDAYARVNFSRHLYTDARFEALLGHWLTNDRIEREIRQRTSQDDVVRDDIAYSVLAAQAERRRADVLRLLAIAADIAQGRGIFYEALTKAPAVAVEEQLDGRLIAWLKDSEQTPAVARTYLAIAAAMNDRSQAWDLHERGVAILRNERARHSHDGGFQRQDIFNIASAEARFGDVAEAVRRLGDWTPQAAIAPVYGELLRKYLTSENAKLVLEAVGAIEDEAGRGYAALAVLACIGRLSADIELVELAKWAEATPTEERRYGEEASTLAIDAVESLLHAGHHELARQLLPRAETPPPGFWHEPAHAFLRYAALREVLTGEALEPKTIGKSRSDGYDADLERVRGILSRAYPAALVRVRAAAGAFDVEQGAASIREAYREKTYRREPARLDVKIAAEELLRAVAYQPSRTPAVVAVAQAMLDEELSNPAHREYGRFAAVLSEDARYHREAEELFHLMLSAERPPNIRAIEAVDVLLRHHRAAAVVDPVLARRVFDAARSLADEIDATIDARSAALLGCYAALIDNGVRPTAEQSHHLAALVEYGADIGEDVPVKRMEDALSLLARVSPDMAGELAIEWDVGAKLHVSVALPPVAVGIAARRDTPVALLASVASFAKPEAQNSFLEQLFAFTVHAGDRSLFASRWAEYIRRMPATGRFSKAEPLLTFAEETGLLAVPEIQRITAETSAAAARGIPKTRKDDITSSVRLKGDEALDSVETLVASSPLDALARLESLDGMPLTDSERCTRVIGALAAALSTPGARRILAVIDRWVGDSSYRIIEALPLLRAVEEHAPSAAGDARGTAAGLLMRPGALSMLPHDYYSRRAVQALRALWKGSPSELFDMLSETIAKNLHDLAADTLYRWIGELVQLCDGEIAASHYDFAGARALARIPAPRSPLSDSDKNGSMSLVAMIGHMLAHPRVEYRFRALYAAIEVLLTDPSLIPAFIAVMMDEEHPRWMTRREWTLLAFQHLSLAKPRLLDAYLDTFAAIATNRAFPHAKHRAHAREIVLTVSQGAPESLSRDTVEAVRRSQQPTAFVEESTRADRRNGRFESWYDKPFHFNSMDTIPYWYEPLGRVFNLSGGDIADRALPWIVERWAITHERCTSESDADKHEYDWRETSNDHGSEPSVETLQSYAERHGMFVVAGELIDTSPVVQTSWGGPFDEWTDWIRTDAREADASLPSRLLGPPPCEPENYGIFDLPFDEWRASRPEGEYLRHIMTNDEVALVAEFEGTSQQYDFDVSVRTIFVPRQTAPAFVRAVNASKEGFYPQSESLHYSTVLPELEADMHLFRDESADDDDEVGADAFELPLTLGELHQELDFHRGDPRWKSFSRHYPYPSLQVQEALGLRRRDSLSLDWLTPDGTLAVRTEMWHDGKADDDVDGSSGYRLLIKKTELARLIETTGYDVAFIVRLKRQSAYRYRRDHENDEYDRGTTFAVLASDLLPT
jgi:hypothetical protein